MKRRNKIDKSTYDWDAGAIAFGDPMDAIKKREFFKQYEKDYNAMYVKEKKDKDRSKILRKNEML
jgi:hypothetical protein